MYWIFLTIIAGLSYLGIVEHVSWAFNWLMVIMVFRLVMIILSAFLISYKAELSHLEDLNTGSWLFFIYAPFPFELSLITLYMLTNEWVLVAITVVFNMIRHHLTDNAYLAWKQQEKRRKTLL